MPDPIWNHDLLKSCCGNSDKRQLPSGDRLSQYEECTFEVYFPFLAETRKTRSSFQASTNQPCKSSPTLTADPVPRSVLTKTTVRFWKRTDSVKALLDRGHIVTASACGNWHGDRPCSWRLEPRWFCNDCSLVSSTTSAVLVACIGHRRLAWIVAIGQRNGSVEHTLLPPPVLRICGKN